MTNTVRYAGQTIRGPSPALWGDLSKWRTDADAGRCAFQFDDYLDSPRFATNGTTYERGWACFADDGPTVNQGAEADLSEGECGTLVLTQDGSTDNDEVWMQKGNNNGAYMLAMDTTAGEGYKFAFEARFKTSTVVDDVQSLFLGIMNPGGAAADTKVDDTGVMQDADWIGFNTVHVNGGTAGTNALLTFSYKATGQTVQNLITDLQTLVADTWYKVGFIYDPSAIAAKRIKVFVAGAEKTTYVTSTLVQTATFPEDVEMCPIIGTKLGAATAGTLSVDWLAFGQYFDQAG